MVVGAYSDSLPIEYGVTVTIDGVTAPLNQNAAKALNIAVPPEMMAMVDPDGSLTSSGDAETPAASGMVTLGVLAGAESVDTDDGSVLTLVWPRPMSSTRLASS